MADPDVPLPPGPVPFPGSKGPAGKSAGDSEGESPAPAPPEPGQGVDPSPDSTPRSPGSASPPARGGGRRPGARVTRAEDVHDRLTLFVVRSIFFLVAGGVGLYAATRFPVGPPSYSILAACALALAVILGEVFFSRAPIRTISAITFGLIIGVVMSAVLNPVVELIVEQVAPIGLTGGGPSAFSPRDRDTLLRFLQMITTTLFCYFGVTLLLQTKDRYKFILPFVEFRREVKGRAPLVVDTSAIIDGRLQSLLSTGIIDQRIVIPRFVFAELQAIADSPDRSRRERGRRGMDVVEELRREHSAEILEEELPAGAAGVDAGLLEVVAAAGGRLVTTDFNLQKRARLQGLPVINLNDLATALKPQFVPGENLRVRLQKRGEDAGQAIGFLHDGTMVVVESADRRIGQEVTVEVTSAIQTSAGKMLFSRLRRSDGQSEPRQDGPRPEGPRSERRRPEDPRAERRGDPRREPPAAR